MGLPNGLPSIFFALITQPKMVAKGKRATIMTSEKSILATLGLQCSCCNLCSDRWTKQALHQACQSYFFLTKLEQLQKVYNILLGARNVLTQEIILKVAGMTYDYNLNLNG
jgi:hypothetical protein